MASTSDTSGFCSTVIERARRLRIRPAVMTFDPHPVRVLAPGHAPKLISTLDQKLRLIESMGIELVFIAPIRHRVRGTDTRRVRPKVSG